MIGVLGSLQSSFSVMLPSPIKSQFGVLLHVLQVGILIEVKEAVKSQKKL